MNDYHHNLFFGRMYMRSSLVGHSEQRHRGPPLWPTAIISTLLLSAGLFFVTGVAGAALQFGAAVPLGIYAAAAASRLRFLGVRAAGTNIALFGGVAASINLMGAGAILWAMCFPGLAQDSALAAALHRLQLVLGGPGLSVPFGLLLAGIAITGGLSRLLPPWLFITGLVLAAISELSWFGMILPQILPLIPLSLFPGFLWLILTGFILPATRTQPDS
jgi:hypothetical protein